MPAASRWRPSCSTSTNSAMPTKSATVACRRGSRTRPGLRRPIVRNSRSKSPKSERLLVRFADLNPPTDFQRRPRSSERTRGSAPMSDAASTLPEHPPIKDWVHDFDHTDPRWTENPFPIWDELRSVSPLVHTDRFLGCYLPTTYEAVREIAHDTEQFF